MSEHPNVTVIDRMTTAVFENDRDTLAQIFTEDMTFHVRGPLPRPAITTESTASSAHMVEWMPAFFQNNAGLELPKAPPVGEDPVRAWEAISDALQAALDDPEVAAREFDMRVGRYTVEDAIATFCIGDVLVHTWDLARATGLDETLDADEVHRMVEGIEPLGDVLEQSGQYGPRVEVPADADEQTRLIAFTGRQP